MNKLLKLVGTQLLKKVAKVVLEDLVNRTDTEVDNKILEVLASYDK